MFLHETNDQSKKAHIKKFNHFSVFASLISLIRSADKYLIIANISHIYVALNPKVSLAFTCVFHFTIIIFPSLVSLCTHPKYESLCSHTSSFSWVLSLLEQSLTPQDVFVKRWRCMKTRRLRLKHEMKTKSLCKMKAKRSIFVKYIPKVFSSPPFLTISDQLRIWLLISFRLCPTKTKIWSGLFISPFLTISTSSDFDFLVVEAWGNKLHQRKSRRFFEFSDIDGSECRIMDSNSDTYRWIGIQIVILNSLPKYNGDWKKPL
jgi:hypothetical protein